MGSLSSEETAAERPNYRYWQERGGEWETIYDDRKHHLVYYHLQEAMVLEYVERTGASSVLEVGCGVGRHLRNLRKICDTHGFDQSPSMNAVVQSWAEPDWFESNVRLGQPRTPLPYTDDAFDVSFTSEVLVHVHPDDIGPLLTEMIRVSRWQVFHIEPSTPDLISSDDHDGCWWHDLAEVYAALGYRYEYMPLGFSSQRLGRVVLDPAQGGGDIPTALLDIYRATEDLLQPTIDRRVEPAAVDALRADRDRLWTEVESWSAYSAELKSAVEAITADRDRLWTELRASVAFADSLHADRDRLAIEVRDRARYGEDQAVEVALLTRQLAEVTNELERMPQRYMRQLAQANQHLVALRRANAAMHTELIPWRRLRKWVEAGRLRSAVSRRITRRLMASSMAQAHTTPIGLRVVDSEDGGVEVWLLDLIDANGVSVPLDSLDRPAGWELTTSDRSHGEWALVGTLGGAELELPASYADCRLHLLGHSWSAALSIRNGDSEVTVPLTSEVTVSHWLHPDGREPDPLPGVLGGLITDPSGRCSEVSHEEFLEAVAHARPHAVGIIHPQWRGIRSSMQNLLSYCWLVPDDVVGDELTSAVRRIAEAGVSVLVTGGYPPCVPHIAAVTRECGIRMLATWHGSFMQYGEPAEHHALHQLINFAETDLIERIGFVKVGMAEAFQAIGVPAATLFNYLRQTPRPAANPSSNVTTLRIGIWSVASIWRKIPYAMLAACASLGKPVTVYASGDDPHLARLAEELGIQLRLVGSAVPQDEMADWLRRMDINLYVTLSECAPMLPLESLAVGVPCLFGPNAHYFDNDRYLRDRLVVPEPDRHERIAESILRAIDEREAILEHYRMTFWPAYISVAEHAMQEFLQAPAGAIW